MAHSGIHHGAGMSRHGTLIALCAASTLAADVALCAALPLPTGDTAPDWIHLLPAGEITTVDSRGPYRISDAEALIAASMADGARLPVDENHATDLLAPQGHPAPARGWITALQARADGIWGQVEWTGAGRELVAGRAYRHVSPVIAHRKDKTVTGVLRASLVNRPNLRGLAALHHQDPSMDFLAKVRQALGLKDDADEAATLTALGALRTSSSTHAAQLAPIAKAAGLAEDADGAAVLQAVQTLRDPAKTVPAETVVALQAEITALKTDRAREKAEGYVDAAIKAGKIAAPAQMRDHYIARHMVDPTAVEKELGAMPSLHSRGAGGGSVLPPKVKDGEPVLDADEAKLVAMMGVDPKAYAATRAKLAEREETL